MKNLETPGKTGRVGRYVHVKLALFIVEMFLAQICCAVHKHQ